jgi:hypothetical protein
MQLGPVLWRAIPINGMDRTIDARGHRKNLSKEMISGTIPLLNIRFH